MRHIGIDPGVKRSYIAYIENDRVDVHMFYSNIDSIYSIASVLKHRDTIYIERPDRLDQKSTLNDILNLAIVCGQMYQSFSYYTHRCELIKPQEWKGQVPKKVTEKRVIERFPAIKKILLNVAESYRHNYYDAVGIAMHCEKVYKKNVDINKRRRTIFRK